MPTATEPPDSASVASGVFAWPIASALHTDKRPPISTSTVITRRIACLLGLGLGFCAGPSGPARASLARAERGLELGLVIVRERGPENRAARALHLFEHAIRRRPAEQDEQRGAVRLQGAGQLLHELVVDANVAERAGDRAGRRARGETQQRHHEDEPAQRAPASAP